MKKKTVFFFTLQTTLSPFSPSDWNWFSFQDGYIFLCKIRHTIRTMSIKLDRRVLSHENGSKSESDKKDEVRRNGKQRGPKNTINIPGRNKRQSKYCSVET